MAAKASQLTPRARRLRAGILSIPGLMEGADVFSDGDAFWIDAKEIAVFDGERLGVRLTRRVISEHRDVLKNDPRVDRRGKSSDWVMVSIAGDSDMAFALHLVELAAEAHRPPAGTPLRPPPEGRDLERRRRFH